MGVHLFRGRFTHPRIGGPPRSISPRKGGVGVHHCYRTSRLGGGGGGVNGKGGPSILQHWFSTLHIYISHKATLGHTVLSKLNDL